MVRTKRTRTSLGALCRARCAGRAVPGALCRARCAGRAVPGALCLGLPKGRDPQITVALEPELPGVGGPEKQGYSNVIYPTQKV